MPRFALPGSLLVIGLAVAGSAVAVDECGALGADGAVTCDETNYDAASDMDISYTVDGADDLSLNLEGGLAVSGGVAGVHDGTGNVTITSGADVTTQADDTPGIHGMLSDEMSAGNLDIELTGGAIATGAASTGTSAYGVEAMHRGRGGRIKISSEADISTQGDAASGVQARFTNAASAGDISIDLRGGSFKTSGLDAPGIEAFHSGSGRVDITSAAAISTEGDGSSGIHAELGSGALNVDVVGGRIVTRGGVQQVDPSETNEVGRAAHGLYIEHGAGGSDDTLVARLRAGAMITALGADAHGISVNNAGLGVANTVHVNGSVMGGAQGGRGVYLSHGGVVNVGSAGLVRAASGVAIEAAAGNLEINILGAGKVDGDVQGSAAAADMTTVTANGVAVVQNNRPTEELAPFGAHELFAEAVGAAVGRRWALRTRQFSSRAFAFEALPQTLLQLTNFSTQLERTGQAQESNGLWMSWEGRRGAHEPSVSTTGLRYDHDWHRLQGGLGRALPVATGTLAGGITGHYVGSFADGIRGSVERQGVAEIDTDGMGLGLYANWRRDDGFYVDWQGRASWYDVNGTAAALDADFDGFGYALGIEGGRRFVVDEGSFIFTPQLQLRYAQISIDDVNLPYRVSFDDGRSVQGRLSLSAESVGKLGESTARLYGLAGVLREFDGETVVDVAATRLVARPARTWGELLLGISVEGGSGDAGAGYAVFCELGGLTSRNSYEYGARVGVRLRF